MRNLFLPIFRCHERGKSIFCRTMPFPPTACMRSATLAFMQTLNRKKLSDFLSNHGIVTTDNARAIYETIIDSPGSYLPYTIGYLKLPDS